MQQLVEIQNQLQAYKVATEGDSHLLNESRLTHLSKRSQEPARSRQSNQASMALNEQMFMFAQTAASNKDQKRFTPTGAAIQNLSASDFMREAARPKSASGFEKRS